jgi:hypothetical protein
MTKRSCVGSQALGIRRYTDNSGAFARRATTVASGVNAPEESPAVSTATPEQSTGGQHGDDRTGAQPPGGPSRPAAAFPADLQLSSERHTTARAIRHNGAPQTDTSSAAMKDACEACSRLPTLQHGPRFLMQAS